MFAEDERAIDRQALRDACRSLDFHRAAEMIDLGRGLAEQALERAGVGSAGGEATVGSAPAGGATA